MFECYIEVLNVCGCMLVEILVKALKSRWDDFRDEIGLWIPVAIPNKEHDDKPEGEEEFGNTYIYILIYMYSSKVL